MELLQQLGSTARELVPRMLWSAAIIGVAMVSGPVDPIIPWIMQPAQTQEPEPN